MQWGQAEIPVGCWEQLPSPTETSRWLVGAWPTVWCVALSISKIVQRVHWWRFGVPWTRTSPNQYPYHTWIQSAEALAGEPPRCHQRSGVWMARNEELSFIALLGMDLQGPCHRRGNGWAPTGCGGGGQREEEIISFLPWAHSRDSVDCPVPRLLYSGILLRFK